jgi:hypothetical protein
MDIIVAFHAIDEFLISLIALTSPVMWRKEHL